MLTLFVGFGRRAWYDPRSKGLIVPFLDALIATVALENDLDLWHHDRHFPNIQKVIPQLKLFQEPP